MDKKNRYSKRGLLTAAVLISFLLPTLFSPLEIHSSRDCLSFSPEEQSAEAGPKVSMSPKAPSHNANPAHPDTRDLPDNIIISELLAVNDGILMDDDGDLSDWVELANNNASQVNLQGWYLTDDPDELTKWRFPDTPIDPQEHILVFASGKDRRISGDELHTNFRLSGEGEYLALVEPNGLFPYFHYHPYFPRQRSNVSYGIFSGEEQYFSEPTPGSANTPGHLGIVPDVNFNTEHGFFDSPFELALDSPNQDAVIKYSRDGSWPDETSGEIYSAPLFIENTTCVRAIAVQTGWLPSDIVTNSYIFFNDVLEQPILPDGFPATWGKDSNATPPGYVPSDYEMDPDIVNSMPLNDSGGNPFDMKDSLRSIPSISLVLDKDDLFRHGWDPDDAGIYFYTWGDGRGYERNCSVEFIDPEGEPGFTHHCGVRLYGGLGRAPRFKKHSFRLIFRSSYGPGSLNYPLFGEEGIQEFNSIILRSNFEDAWHNLYTDTTRDLAQLIRDEWTRAAQIAMGSMNSRGTFVHLYVNGLYWGLYNPIERPDESYLTSYFGGENQDWDVIHEGEMKNGNRSAWDKVIEMAGEEDMWTNESYRKIQGENPDGTPNPDFDKLINTTNLIDYILLNLYAGSMDWDHHNWHATRKRDNSEAWRFFVWDGEMSLLDTWGQDLTGENNYDCPSWIYQALRKNWEFRQEFGDRVYHHFFNNGSLTPENAMALYRKLAERVDLAIPAESARWGDVSGKPSYDRDHWLAVRDALYQELFPNRTDVVLGFLKDASLYPKIEPPEFMINGTDLRNGELIGDEKLEMACPNGTIYYTLDGNDPCIPGVSLYSDLIQSGEVWNYLDNGSDQGTEWRTGDINWPSGPAELGYGDGDEATEVDDGRTLPGDPCYITTYFRKTFHIDDADEHSKLIIKLLRDDGAVVYLNGVELVRSNMPEGIEIDYMTEASDYTPDEDMWFEYLVDAEGILMEGDNIIAVEVHQDSDTSSDISFDLQLSSEKNVLGTPSSTALVYSSPITLERSATVKTRALYQGEWSALNKADITTVRKIPKVVINELMADNENTISYMNGPGNFSDWIEIYNLENRTVDISGLCLCDNLSTALEWQFPMGSFIAPKGHLLVWASGDRRLGPLHTGFRLNASGEQVSLVEPDGETVIDSVSFGDIPPDVSYGRYPDGNGTWIYMEDNPSPGLPNMDNDEEIVNLPQGIVINEFMASNRGIIQGPNGTYPDWIELYNTGNESLDLHGCFLSDDPLSPDKYIFPQNTTVSSKGYLVLWCGENEWIGDDCHWTSFGLRAQGENINLFASDGFTLIDSVDFGDQSGNVSMGRFPDGVDNWEFMADHPSPGSFNRLDDPPAEPPVILINEFMARPNPPELTDLSRNSEYLGFDWIELFNPGSSTINMQGLYLTDNLANPDKWVFPPNSSIKAGGFLVVLASGRADLGDLHASFKLDGNGEEIGLFHSDGYTLIDSRVFGVQNRNASMGRYPDGGPDWIMIMDNPSPGEPNIKDEISIMPDNIVINEFMADNGATLEYGNNTGIFPDWIELYNRANFTVDLGGMFLTDNLNRPLKWMIPPGTEIPPHGFLVIWADNMSRLGGLHAGFKLNASGEEIALFTRDGASLLDSVAFSPQTEDVSYGRFTDGTDSWHYLDPSPGDPNILRNATEGELPNGTGDPNNGHSGDNNGGPPDESGGNDKDKGGGLVTWAIYIVLILIILALIYAGVLKMGRDKGAEETEGEDVEEAREIDETGEEKTEDQEKGEAEIIFIGPESSKKKENRQTQILDVEIVEERSRREKGKGKKDRKRGRRGRYGRLGRSRKKEEKVEEEISEDWDYWGNWRSDDDRGPYTPSDDDDINWMG